ncbi:MAG: S8 family serine peptidase, partial [Nanoarchaeota archaeon]
MPGQSCNAQGQCINNPDGCTDSDGGINYFVKGTVVDKSGGSGYTDFCPSNYVIEYYCGADGYFLQITEKCKFSCRDGACTGCIPKTCAELGKQCGSWNNECGGTLNCGNCSEGNICSSSGSCTSITCTDSDGGKNYEKKGTTLNNTGSFSDFCKDNILTEYYCSEYNLMEEKKECFICTEGRCLHSLNFTIDISTPKDVHEFGEKIMLTSSTHSSEEFIKGYIIQLEGLSIAAKEKELYGLAKKNEELSELNPLKYFSLRIEDVPQKIEEYKQELSEKQLLIKKSIPSYEHIVMNEYLYIFNGFALDIDEETAFAIKKILGVKNVYPNRIYTIDLMNSVDLINATAAWKLGYDGKGIIIGVTDTGIDYTHADLGSCTKDQFLTGNCRKVAKGYDFFNKDSDPMDDHGHGTHVAATAAGNGKLKGVAPNATLYAYKMCDNFGSCPENAIIAGIEQAVKDKVDIISMSLGGRGTPDEPISQAADTAVDAGVIFVVAAGNSGPTEQTIGCPGCARKVITVGATDKQRNIASFSSRGPVIWIDSNQTQQYLTKPDVVAPGVNICAAQFNGWFSNKRCLDEKHIAISGTSMATPHVAGAVALIKQAHPNWDPEEIKTALKSTAVSLGYGSNAEGAGLINVFNTIALSSPPPLVELIVIGKDSFVDIYGTIKSKTIQHWELSFHLANRPVQVLKQGDNTFDKKLLYKDFPIDEYPYLVPLTFNLTVVTSTGKTSSVFTFMKRPEEGIITQGTEDHPSIYGDTIVFLDYKGDSTDNEKNYKVLMYNIPNKIITPLHTKGISGEPHISDKYITWVSLINRSWIIYLYDIAQKKKIEIGQNPIIPNHMPSVPRVSGHYLVWRDTYLFLYDIDKPDALPVPIHQGWIGPRVDIDEDKVVYSIDYPTSDIYLYDITKNTKTKISTVDGGIDPRISGNKVVYSRGFETSGIYVYDILTKTTKEISSGGTILWQNPPEIDGDRIVYLASPKRFLYELFMYDLSNDKHVTLISDTSYNGDLDIHKSFVTWIDGRGQTTDVYFVDINKIPHFNECDDFKDNDGDGKVDFPYDAGCTNSIDNDESNCGDGVCEGGESWPSCTLDCLPPQCSDNKDNDGDGKIDFPNDTECKDILDDNEDFDRFPSLIKNNENFILEGQLLMKLQKKEGNNWLDEQFVIDKKISISPASIHSLASEWNPRNVISKNAGNYRVFTHFSPFNKTSSNSWNIFVKELAPFCNETDNGRDYYVRGKTYNNTNQFEDSCSNDTLIEYYCQGAYLFSEQYECTGVCHEGSCIDLQLGSLLMSVGSIKENFTIQEPIYLTDPPDSSLSVPLIDEIIFSTPGESFAEGYIVQFKDDPPAGIHKKELELEAQKNEEKIEAMHVLNPMKYVLPII